jgi:hypothetical protein
VRRLNGAKHEDKPIWMGQVNVKNGIATHEAVKDDATVIRQVIGVINVYKTWYVFGSKK